MAQLRSQFVAVVMERDLARTFKGKTAENYCQYMFA